MKKIIEKSLEKSMTYQAYRDLVTNLLEKGETTSQDNRESMIEYSKLNNSRMKRLDKTTKLSEDLVSKLQTIDKPVEWIVLTEGWCGDAAQTLPVINKMAEQNKNITLRVVLRDENQDLMNEFLTNGGQSIPKLIQVENNEVTSDWGPRPTLATKLVNDFKKEHGQLTPEFKKDLQVWYNKDKGQSTIDDMSEFLGLA